MRLWREWQLHIGALPTVSCHCRHCQSFGCLCAPLPPMAMLLLLFVSPHCRGSRERCLNSLSFKSFLSLLGFFFSAAFTTSFFPDLSFSCLSAFAFSFSSAALRNKSIPNVSSLFHL